MRISRCGDLISQIKHVGGRVFEHLLQQSGVEVFNGNPRHDSHNDLARRFAEEHGLRMLSGSDAHQPQDVARGGILAPDWVRSSGELARFLRETHRPHMIMDGK